MTISNGILYIQRDGRSGNSVATHDWVNFDDSVEEVINHTRTAALLEAMRPKDFEAVREQDWLDDGLRVPSSFWSGSMAGVNIAEPTSPGDPANPAPWYDANVAASAETCGFMVVDSSGTDDSTTGRVVAGESMHGVTTGRLRDRERTISVRVQCIGTSARGAKYLYRWLARKLRSMDPNVGDAILFREYHLDASHGGEFGSTEEWVSAGLRRIADVGLVAGPTLEAPNRGIPEVIEATFTLVAARPAITSRLVGTAPVVSTKALPLNTSTTQHAPTAFPAHEYTFPFGSGSEFGVVAPVLNIGCEVDTTGGGVGRRRHSEMVVAVLDGPDASTADVISGFRIRNLPSGAILRVDYSARRVWMFDPWLGVPNGEWLLLTEGGPDQARDPHRVGAEGYQSHNALILGVPANELPTWEIEGAQALFVTFQNRGRDEDPTFGEPIAEGVNYSVSCALLDMISG